MLVEVGGSGDVEEQMRTSQRRAIRQQRVHVRSYLPREEGAGGLARTKPQRANLVCPHNVTGLTGGRSMRTWPISPDWVTAQPNDSSVSASVLTNSISPECRLLNLLCGSNGASLSAYLRALLVQLSGSRQRGVRANHNRYDAILCPSLNPQSYRREGRARRNPSVEAVKRLTHSPRLLRRI